MILQKIKTLYNKAKENIIRRLFPNLIINKCNALLKDNKIEVAINILLGTLKYHPSNITIHKLLVESYIELNDWKNAIKFLDKLLKNDLDISSNLFKELADCYFLHNEQNSEKTSIQNNYWRFYVDIALEEQYRALAAKAIEEIYSERSNDLEKMNAYIYLSMLHQLEGNQLKASEIFDYVTTHFSQELANDSDGYRKLIIFDNGESRIEFYKKLQKTNRVIVTFDSIYMEWDGPSFAFKLLSRQDNLDIIAIRKREKQTYQQDLTRENFMNVLEKLVNCYEEKMSYGFSLGAYNSLYFASLLNCRILAISPRLSIHPIYGRTKIIPKYDFKQNISLPNNESISPIIVFDPKNKLDNRYVHKEVIKAFPNSILIKVPYAGHGVAPHLSVTGQLKDFVVSFINNEIPKYNRKERVKSASYFKYLATACLKHNKLSWALNLINRSIDLSLNKDALKVKIDILNTMERYEESVQVLESFIEQYPNILTYRNLLFDTLVKVNKLSEAENVLNDSIEVFGNMPSLKRRKEILENNLNVLNL